MILDDILKILKKRSKNKAYTINKKSFSYSELYNFSCNLYNFILEENKEKKPIIVYGHKEIYIKATFLACSFAGITYVPVDESLPEQRINNIIEQVEPYCIIGDFESNKCKNISKNEIYNIMNRKSITDINKIYLRPDDIYYIIFTSGSTGMPKGVKVTYRNLNSCINWLNSIIQVKKGIILNQANFSFDLSVADLYLSLISESEHFIIENRKKLDFLNVFEDLKRSNATVAVMTPSFADLLLLDKSFGKEILPNLRTIIFCGERLLKATALKLRSRFDDIKIINSYGPTECTFAVTSIEVTDEILKQDNIPVGKPKEDTEIIIVDKNKNKLNDGQVGEILIAGESVAEGYIGNNKQHTFIKYNKKNAYLTGDLGYLKNGILYFEHRIDNQIKYKGYRIELSDIENNLYKLDYLEKVKVVEKTTNDGIVTNIVAFVKIKQGVKKTEVDIKKDFKAKVPDYMSPNIKILNEFPINNNGKIDIQGLRRLINER